MKYNFWLLQNINMDNHIGKSYNLITYRIIMKKNIV